MKGPELIQKLKNKEKVDAQNLEESLSTVRSLEQRAKDCDNQLALFQEEITKKYLHDASSLLFSEANTFDKTHKDSVSGLSLNLSRLEKSYLKKKDAYLSKKAVQAEQNDLWSSHEKTCAVLWNEGDGAGIVSEMSSLKSLLNMYTVQKETLSETLQEFRDKIKKTSWFHSVETSDWPWSDWLRRVSFVTENRQQMMEMEDKLIEVREKEGEISQELERLENKSLKEKELHAQKSNPSLKEALTRAERDCSSLENEMNSLEREIAIKKADLAEEKSSFYVRREKLIEEAISSGSCLSSSEKRNLSKMKTMSAELSQLMKAARSDYSQKEKSLTQSKSVRKKAEQAGYSSSEYSFPAAVVLGDFSSIERVADYDRPSSPSSRPSADNRSNDTDSFGGGSFGGGSFGGGGFSTGGGF